MTAMEFESNHDLEFILSELAATLQLTPTQHAAAVGHYQALSTWLSADESPLAAYDINVYAQGSMALGTTVKPLSDAEFDLDFVCQVQAADLDSLDLYEMFVSRLEANETYRTMLTKKKRCVCLTYADSFHADVIPAVPDPAHGVSDHTNLLIPDRDLKGWTFSNPRGFAGWFKERSRVLVRRGLRADANVEPLPKLATVDEKTPLSIAIQLIKRLRDRSFADDVNAPRSIVLTTLAALEYRGDESVLFAMMTAAQAFERFASVSNPSLFNPANAKENFADKLNASQTANLMLLSSKIKTAVSAIISTRGLDSLREVLAALFGDRPVVAALKRFSDRHNEHRAARTLTYGARGLGIVASTGGSIAPRNNYFGPKK